MSAIKVVRCRDVGFDCGGVVKAADETELLNKVAEHAKNVHNVQEITEDMVNKIKSVIQEEEKQKIIEEVKMQENTLITIVRLKSKPGKEAELKELLQGLLIPTRNEPGCISYELLMNKEDPTEFTFVEQWKDDNALNGHFETSHIKNALQKLPDILAEDMDLRKYDYIS
jgi:quinol monooxygenase YgiN/predicted small metal-binding protein